MKRLPAVLLAIVLAIAGCSAAAVPPTTSGPGSVAPSDPVATDPGGGTIGGGGGGGGGAAPLPGQPTVVLPKPGQQNVHDVSIEELTARVAGRHVVLNARWWSGVEPCNVLDSVAFKRDGQSITVAVREGSSGREVMCIEIAMLKVTPVDLGDLDPGVYTIAASQGLAAAITVTVE